MADGSLYQETFQFQTRQCSAQCYLLTSEWIIKALWRTSWQCFFIARVKLCCALCCSAGLCSMAGALGTRTACRWSFHGLKIAICMRRHQTSRLTAFYRVMVYLYHLRVKSRLAWNLTVSRLCCAVVWYYGKIARLDVWRWSAGLVAGSLAVDRLNWWQCGWFKGLWISKGKTRVPMLYHK